MFFRNAKGRALAGLAGLVLIVGTGACRQGENDRCQIDSDCEDGLYCELAGNSRAQGGYCRRTASGTVDLAGSDMALGPADLAPGPDMAGSDLTADLPASDGGGG